MKRGVFCSLLFIYSIFTVSAQVDTDHVSPLFAIINDPDGYTNVRDENAKVIGKIYNDEIFAVLGVCEPIGKYLPIEWKLDSVSNTAKSGYIHESRIKYLCQLPQLKKKIINNSAFFEKDNIKITIRIGALNINDKRITWDPKYKTLSKIDGCRVWGGDCFNPKDPRFNTEIKSIEYTIDGVTRQFGKKDISGFLALSIESIFVAIGNNDTLYIVMENGDGAGAYDLLWVLEDGEITRKIVHLPF